MNDSTPDAGHAMWSLIHAARALEDRIESGLTRLGVSSAKLGVLTELVKAGEPLTLSDLASRIKCVRSNVTQLVDRMETEGLVKREDHPQDRRSIHAALTPLGRDKHEAGEAQVQAVQVAFARSLSAADRDALQRLLGTIR